MNTPSSKYSPKYSGTVLVPAGHSSDVDISLGNPVSEQNTILYRCRGTRAGEPNVNIAYVPRGSKKNTFYLIIILAIAILNNNYCCVLLTLVKIFFYQVIMSLCEFSVRSANNHMYRFVSCNNLFAPTSAQLGCVCETRKYRVIKS